MVLSSAVTFELLRYFPVLNSFQSDWTDLEWVDIVPMMWLLTYLTHDWYNAAGSRHNYPIQHEYIPTKYLVSKIEIFCIRSDFFLGVSCASAFKECMPEERLKLEDALHWCSMIRWVYPLLGMLLPEVAHHLEVMLSFKLSCQFGFTQSPKTYLSSNIFRSYCSCVDWMRLGT